MTIPQHSAASPTWRTPPHVIDLVHKVFDGPPDLDPASSALANETVRAGQILTEADDALTATWPKVRSVFLNPPGGRVGSKSLAGLFWARFVEMYESHRFYEGIFLGFTLEILRTAQNYVGPGSMTPLDCTICVPRERLRFLDEKGQPGRSPAHANVIVYLSPSLERDAHFYRVFRVLGSTR